MANIKYCYDCKYYMFGACLHKNAAHCNHSELWTPIDFEPFNMSMLHLPDDIKDLIEFGIYTEEEVLKYIENHGYTNRLTEYESVGGHAHAIPKTTDMDIIVQKLAEYEDAEQQGRLIFLEEDNDY